MDQETPPFDTGTAVILSNDHTKIDCGLTPLQPQMPFEGRLTSLPSFSNTPLTNVAALTSTFAASTGRISNTPARLPCLNMAANISADHYHQQWPLRLQQFHAALNMALAAGRAFVVLIEGWDGGGKSGTIRRIFNTLDPALCTIRHTIAPTETEATHPFLWRFESALPPAGHILVLDRSWYGRVLVERAEGLISATEWQRAYREIRDFENNLHKDGIEIFKFWLHIDRAEHTRRLHQRIYHAEKRHKLGISDFKNHILRRAYEAAAEDMFAFTHTAFAPWHIVPANDKKYGRMSVLTTLLKALQIPNREIKYGTA